MIKISVRCWEIKNYRALETCPDSLFINYLEENSGHELITCISCGEVYDVTVVKEVYIGPPLDKKVKGMKCVNCGGNLEDNFDYYPETYIASGAKYTFTRNMEIPTDKESLVKDFYGIYEQDSPTRVGFLFVRARIFKKIQYFIT